MIAALTGHVRRPRLLRLQEKERSGGPGYSLATRAAVGYRRAVSKVSDILRAKGTEILKIDGSSTVFEAIKKMVDVNVGSVLVTDGGEVVGIMTERDYLRRVTLEGRTDKEALVSEIMSAPIIYVTPETSIDECMALMTDRRIRHLPVVEDDEVVGVVSIGDVVKFQSREQSFQIQYLTEYITGR